MYSQCVRLRWKTWLCPAIRAVAGFSGHLRRRAYFGCHLGCYIIVLFTGHGLIISTALFGGADWQLPSLEWSVCFSDSAKAIWCILTIIGATATMMFSKPLCYFPGGCPRGMKSTQSSETPSEAGQKGRLLSRADQWHHDLTIIIIITYGCTVCLVVSSDQQPSSYLERALSSTHGKI